MWKYRWNNTVCGTTRYVEEHKFTRVLFISSLTYEKAEYAKEVSGYKAMHWFSLFRRKKLHPSRYGPAFF